MANSKTKKNLQIGIGLVLYALVTFANRFFDMPVIIYRIIIIVAIIFFVYGLYTTNREITKRQKQQATEEKK